MSNYDKYSRSFGWNKTGNSSSSVVERGRLPKPPTSVSMCIPRIESQIERTYIQQVFSKLNIGHIERLTEIPLRNDNTHKRIIIKLSWNDTTLSEMIQTRLKEDKTVKVVHDSPWSFWKVVRAN
uniref:Uncharacterized protein n=1 Tax=viral metagenome TaxID=1070528 RepID=A0A6C0I4C8_9ZZZZ